MCVLRVCVRACVRVCVRVCVCVCVRVCKLRKLLVCLICNFCIFSNCSFEFENIRFIVYCGVVNVQPRSNFSDGIIK